MTPVTKVRDRLGAELFRRVAGPDGPKHRERIHGTPGPRWFPADSPIARVHGDAAMFIGGIRAVLLQTMQPAAMTAVAEHSGYRGDMWGRLARTSRFLAVTTFGTEDDAQQAVDIVRSIHDRVRGSMPDGTTYSAADPHLLLWVHVAEVKLPHRPPALRQAAARPGRPRRVRRPDSRGRAKLGVLDPPTTEAGLTAAVEAFRPELAATDHAREAVSFLVWHPPLPWAARPGYGALVAAAIGLMPVWTRRPLRLPWFPVSERTVVRALGGAATGTIRWALRPPPSDPQDAAPAATSASPSAVRQ